MDKPLKKLTYWIARGKQQGIIDIRCRTRKDCKVYMHKSYHETPVKVTVLYRDILDLVIRASGTITNEWEKR